MGKIMYCKRCGAIYHILFNKKCKYCGTTMNQLSKEYRFKYNLFTDNWAKSISKLDMYISKDEENKIVEDLLSREKDFIMNEVFNNSLFSVEEYNKQVESNRASLHKMAENSRQNRLELQRKNLEKMRDQESNDSCIPKCPTCGSTHVKPITTAERAVSVAGLGIASKKINKSYKCLNCKCTW